MSGAKEEIKTEFWVLNYEEAEALKFLESRDYIVYKKNSGRAVIVDKQKYDDYMHYASKAAEIPSIQSGTAIAEINRGRKVSMEDFLDILVEQIPPVVGCGWNRLSDDENRLKVYQIKVPLDFFGFKA